jgi:hypothetical protein
VFLKQLSTLALLLLAASKSDFYQNLNPGPCLASTCSVQRPFLGQRGTLPNYRTLCGRSQGDFVRHLSYLASPPATTCSVQKPFFIHGGTLPDCIHNAMFPLPLLVLAPSKGHFWLLAELICPPHTGTCSVQKPFFELQSILTITSCNYLLRLNTIFSMTDLHPITACPVQVRAQSVVYCERKLRPRPFSYKYMLRLTAIFT